MKIGLVGKPSAGKSTFFKALTLQEVEISNRPFTTIKPNIGTAYVKVKGVAEEFGVTANPRRGYCFKGYRFVPVEVIDVAGLVPGAHEGKGLGNQFLDELRQADVLIHIVDASGSTDENGRYIGPGNHDPCKDIRFLEEEISYWIKGILERNFEKISRLELQAKKKKEELLLRTLSGLNISIEEVKKALEYNELSSKPLKEWKSSDLLEFAKRIREISKPIVIAANKSDVDTSKENIKRMKKEFPEKLIVPVSAYAELALKLAARKKLIEYVPGESDFKIIGKPDEKQEALLNTIKEKVLKPFGTTGVQEVLDKAVFDVLGYVAVFPVANQKLRDKEGRILPDCFLMRPNSTALDLAFKIHEELGRNFIRAIDVRTGKFLGKDYKLRHRDVIEIIAGKS